MSLQLFIIFLNVTSPKIRNILLRIFYIQIAVRMWTIILITVTKVTCSQVTVSQKWYKTCRHIYHRPLIATKWLCVLSNSAISGRPQWSSRSFTSHLPFLVQLLSAAFGRNCRTQDDNFADYRCHRSQSQKSTRLPTAETLVINLRLWGIWAMPYNTWHCST